jgi:hypothetical protein
MNHSGRIPRVIYGRSEEAFQIWRIPKRFNLKHRTTVNHGIVGVLINIVNRCGDETPDKATKNFSVIYDHFIEMISLTGRHSRMGVASTSVFVQELSAPQGSPEGPLLHSKREINGRAPNRRYFSITTKFTVESFTPGEKLTGVASAP